MSSKSLEHREPSAPEDVAEPPGDALRSASGLVHKRLREGTGAQHPCATDTVRAHVTGWTAEGVCVEGSNPSGAPVRFPLKAVIAGLSEGVQLMVVGEKRRFWIPANLAYGETPERAVPAGKLVYDVELLEIVTELSGPERQRAQAAREAAWEARCAVCDLIQGGLDDDLFAGRSAADLDKLLRHTSGQPLKALPDEEMATIRAKVEGDEGVREAVTRYIEAEQRARELAGGLVTYQDRSTGCVDFASAVDEALSKALRQALLEALVLAHMAKRHSPLSGLKEALGVGLVMGFWSVDKPLVKVSLFTLMCGLIACLVYALVT